MSKLFAQSSTSNQGQHQEEASDQVDYTISQDRAAGNFAQEEFNYQLLMSNRFDFLSPSASFVRPGWNDALRDDQLQLRLPEQQNRKGLIIPSQAGDALLVSFLEARESRKRKLAELEEEVNFNSEKDDNRGGRNGGQDTDRPDENHQPNNLSLEASHHALQDLEASQPTRDPNKVYYRRSRVLQAMLCYDFKLTYPYSTVLIQNRAKLKAQNLTKFKDNMTNAPP